MYALKWYSNSIPSSFFLILATLSLKYSLHRTSLSRFFSHTDSSFSVSITGSPSSSWPLSIGPLLVLIFLPSTHSLVTSQNHTSSSNLFREYQTQKINCLLSIYIWCSNMTAFLIICSAPLHPHPTPVILFWVNVASFSRPKYLAVILEFFLSTFHHIHLAANPVRFIV